MEENLVFQIELLYYLVDQTYYELFLADFSSLSDFDNTCTYDACTDTHQRSIKIIRSTHLLFLPVVSCFSY